MKRVKLTNCKKTRAIVETTFKNLLKHAGPAVKNVFDIGKFSIEGSVRCNVKVGDPDEVDIQLPLKIPSEDITFLRKGTCWTNEDCDCGKHRPVRNGRRKKNSYIGEDCEYKIKKIDISNQEFGVHCIKVNDDCVVLNHLKKYGIIKHLNHLSPRAVMYFLLMQLRRAETKFNTNNPKKYNVRIFSLVNGPAVLMTINGPDVKYKIKVDVVPSLDYPVSKLISKQKRIIKDGINRLPKTTQTIVGDMLCLIPKFEDVWKLSFSKFENNILDSFYDGDDSDDEDYDCKKDCLRYTKYRLLKWKKNDPDGLKNISSYMLKTLLLRALVKNRKRADWTRQCFKDRCMDMMKDFADCLSDQEMTEFFNDDVNLLEDKGKTLLANIKSLIEDELRNLKRFK